MEFIGFYGNYTQNTIFELGVLSILTDNCSLPLNYETQLNLTNLPQQLSQKFIDKEAYQFISSSLPNWNDTQIVLFWVLVSIGIIIVLVIITILIIFVLKRNRKGSSSKQTGQIEAKIVSNHRGSKQIKPNNVHNNTQSEIMDTSVVALGVS